MITRQSWYLLFLPFISWQGKGLTTTLVEGFVVGGPIHRQDGFSSGAPIQKSSRRSIWTRLATWLQARSICTFEDSDFSASSKDGSTALLESINFNRLDNSDDAKFYKEPRFVNHIDDAAILALQTFYQQEMESMYQGQPLDVLDLCSSWTSHYPTEKKEEGTWNYGRVVGLGMNEQELQANPILTERVVHDLNVEPSLIRHFPDDGCFDLITMAVSVDYLIQPIPVFQEIHRLLRPGTGTALISFSNRCFPTKAIASWLQGDDLDRITLVASYFYYSTSRGWAKLEALDLKDAPLELPKRPSTREILANPALGLAWMNSAAAVQRSNAGDPMFVVKAVKDKAATTTTSG
jgi:SAM-dependent methyltransferase